MPRLRLTKSTFVAASIFFSMILFLSFTESGSLHVDRQRLDLDGPIPTLALTNRNHKQVPLAAGGHAGDRLTYGRDGLVHGLLKLQRALKKRRRALQDEQHPITELMERGRRRWEGLLKRQSKTLQNAVTEYRKRYARDPPLGFDKWFEFCKERGVKIIDDYDQIERDIGPWLGIAPAQFRRRVDLLEDLQFSYKMVLRPGKESLLSGDRAHAPRPNLTFHFLEPIVPYLTEEITLYASDHDMGNSVVSEQLRNAALDAAAKRTYLTQEQLALYENQADHGLGLLASCETTSPARQMNETAPLKAANAFIAQKDNSSSFVYDPRQGHSYCQNPDLMKYHGAFSWPQRRSAQMRPVFQLSKLAQNHEFLLAPLEAFKNASSEDGQKAYLAWEDKTIDKLFWRGSSTGDSYTVAKGSRPGYDWRTSHRPRLHLMAQQQEGDTPVWVKRPAGWQPERWGNDDLNDRYMDVGFAGKVHQCNEEDGTCAAMAEALEFRQRVQPEQARLYKYVLDVDGNGWSSRFHRLLSSGSVVVKATIYPEWNSDWLTPWVHYVPAKIDYSDLYDIMSFFTGTPDDRTGAHDRLAAQIAANARKFTTEHWRWEDMQAYMFRMLLEYARLGAEDREAHSFKL